MIIFYHQSLLLLPQTFQHNPLYLVLWLRLAKVVQQEQIVALGFVLEVIHATVFVILTRQQHLLPLPHLRLPPFRHLLLNQLEVALQRMEAALPIVNAALTNNHLWYLLRYLPEIFT